ncbi:uncharacterized protein [Amphiura filiformis]|uniref:uncharacterized protein n=1 Tax=Amphiura filiformis TaxID=82378 RepID=UPI003B20F584
MNRMRDITTRIPNQPTPYNPQDSKWTSTHVHSGSLDESRGQTASGPYADAPASNHQQTNGSKKNSQTKRSKSRYGGGSRYKRNRTIFNVAQLDALARIFEENRYPDAPLRKKIAERLDIDEERIQIWFQNRRAKTRRTQREDNDGKSPANSNPDAGPMNEHSPGVPTPDAQKTHHHITGSIPPVTDSPQQTNGSTSSITSSATFPSTTRPAITQNDNRGQVHQSHHDYSYGKGHSSSKQSVSTEPRDLKTPTTCVTTPSPAPSNHSYNASHTPSIVTSPVPNTNSYTQHYVSNSNGHTSRIPVNNTGRSTEGRLRPETRVTSPPPNQVCTQIPDTEKNELSKALFRFGLAIGQSAGLDVDANQLVETQELEQADAASQVLSQRCLPVKKRRRKQRMYPNSDTSSDSDEDNPRKRRRRIPGGEIDRSGPPNRLATAVPESDRTLPAILRNGNAGQELVSVFEGVPDLLIDETSATDALESPFSIDILSSPEPESSTKSPSSTSTSSMSDWSDFEDTNTVPKSYHPDPSSNTKPSTLVNDKHCGSKVSGIRHDHKEEAHKTSETYGPIRMSQNVHPLPRLEQRHFSTRPARQYSPVDTDPSENRDDGTPHTYAHHEALIYQPQQRLHTESFRNRSFSDPAAAHHSSPVQQRNPPNVTISPQQPEQCKSTPHLAPNPMVSESHRNDWIPYDTYLYSSSSSASEENRRNQVSEILAESRKIADHMPCSSPASPFSEDSGTRSPASWLLAKSPQSFGHLQHHEVGRSDHYLPHQATASFYDHQLHSYRMSASTPATLPHGHFPTYTSASPSRNQYNPPPSFSRTDGSSHTVIRPVPKFPSTSDFHTNYRSSYGMC